MPTGNQIYANVLAGSDSGWGGYNTRVVIPVSQLVAAQGGSTYAKVIFSFASGTSGGSLFAYIGEQGSGNVYNFDGNQKQLLFAGATSKTGINGAVSITSDPVAFTYSPSVPLIVSFYVAGTEVDFQKATVTGLDGYYISAANNSGTTAPAGTWTLFSDLMVAVASVEMVPPPGVSVNVTPTAPTTIARLFTPTVSETIAAATATAVARVVTIGASDVNQAAPKATVTASTNTPFLSVSEQLPISAVTAAPGVITKSVSEQLAQVSVVTVAKAGSVSIVSGGNVNININPTTVATSLGTSTRVVAASLDDGYDSSWSSGFGLGSTSTVIATVGEIDTSQTIGTVVAAPAVATINVNPVNESLTSAAPRTFATATGTIVGRRVDKNISAAIATTSATAVALKGVSPLGQVAATAVATSPQKSVSRTVSSITGDSIARGVAAIGGTPIPNAAAIAATGALGKTVAETASAASVTATGLSLSKQVIKQIGIATASVSAKSLSDAVTIVANKTFASASATALSDSISIGLPKTQSTADSRFLQTDLTGGILAASAAATAAVGNVNKSLSKPVTGASCSPSVNASVQSSAEILGEAAAVAAASAVVGRSAEVLAEAAASASAASLLSFGTSQSIEPVIAEGLTGSIISAVDYGLLPAETVATAVNVIAVGAQDILVNITQANAAWTVGTPEYVIAGQISGAYAAASVGELIGIGDAPIASASCVAIVHSPVHTLYVDATGVFAAALSSDISEFTLGREVTISSARALMVARHITTEEESTGIASGTSLLEAIQDGVAPLKAALRAGIRAISSGARR